MRGPVRRFLSERLEERPLLSALRERRSRDAGDGDEPTVSEEQADGGEAPPQTPGGLRERLSLFSTKAKDTAERSAPISKQGEEAYCYTCIRDHLHKVQGLLREAEKQLTRDGKITTGIRRKVALAESELSSAETEHVWNVKLDDPQAQKTLDDIGSELSNLRKRLENTQIGFEHPGIPARGGLEDIKKAIADAGVIKEQVYNAMVECPTCNIAPLVAERMKR